MRSKMRLAEPATSLTDVALAITAYYSAWRIAGENARIDWAQVPLSGSLIDRTYSSHLNMPEHAFVRFWLVLWIAAFIALGCAAFAGAIEHAIPLDRERERSYIAKLITMILSISSTAIFVAACALVIANTEDYSGFGGYMLLAAALFFGVLKVIVITVYAIVTRELSFAHSLIDFAAALGLLAIAHRLSIAPLGIEGTPGANWLLAGIITAVVSSTIQYRKIALHRHFDHNALFHVVMIPALWLLSEGAIRAVGGLG